MSAGLGPFGAQEHYRQRIRQTDENSARMAWSFAHLNTYGWGEFLHPEIVVFDVTFTAMPYMAYGYAVNGDTLVPTRYPRASAFVYRWRQDVKGFYTGCWIGFAIDTRSAFIDTNKLDPGYTLDHFFTFGGIAYKDLPAHLLDV